MAGLVQRDRFHLHVDLTADEVWQRLLRHPGVRETEEPAPDPPPPDGPRFLASRQSTHEIRVRHWAGPADAPSPVIVIRLDPDGNGCRINGRFDRRRRQGALSDRVSLRRPSRAWTWAAVLTIVLSIALVTPVVIGTQTIHVLLLLLVFSVPTILVFVPGLIIWHSEIARGFIGPLWELVGEVFTPVATPIGEAHRAPFRGALPRGADGA